MKVFAVLLVAAATSALAHSRLPLHGQDTSGQRQDKAAKQPRGQFNAHPVDDETAAALKAIANRVATHRAETHEEDTTGVEDEHNVLPAGSFATPHAAASRDLSDEELMAAVHKLAGGAAAPAAKAPAATSPAIAEQYNEIAETLKRRRLCSAGQYYTKKKGKWFKKSVR